MTNGASEKLGKDKTSEELKVVITKLSKALEGCTKKDVLYLVAEIICFSCMSSAETLTEAIDCLDSFDIACKNHIKRTFGEVWEFRQKRQRKKGSRGVKQ